MNEAQVIRFVLSRRSEPAPMYGRRVMSPKAMANAYDGAGTDNYSARWSVNENTPDAELANALPALRARSADLVRNNAPAYGIIDTIQQGVVGRGPRWRSPNAKINTLFERWSKAAGWDGVSSWSDVCDDLISAACISGDVLVIWPDVGDGSEPRVDLIDARRIDTPTDKTPEVYSSRLGVGYDKYGRVQGYYVKKSDEGGTGWDNYHFFPLNKNGRVNARLFKRPSIKRPRQSRTPGILAPMMHNLKEIPAYLLTESRRATQAAKVHTIISTPDPKAISDAFENADGINDDLLEAMSGRSYGNTPDGTTMVLGLGESAQVATPPQVNGGTGEYIKAHLQVDAMATGLPNEEVFNLYAGMNFSNARTVRLKSKAVYNKWRDKVLDGLCNPTIALLVMYWWANGELGRVPWSEELLAGKWHWDEMEWVDPVKEVTANEKAIATGQKSIISICASQGLDAREVVDENLMIEAYEMQKRIALRLPPKGSAPAAQSAPAEDQEDPAPKTPKPNEDDDV